MEIYELKNKILEVLAYARVVSIRNGHTGKYAKHVVALVVKQTMHFTDNELTEFLSTNEMGRILGYKTRFNHTIFSKVRKTSSKIVKELYEFLIYQKMKGKQIRLVVIDSTDIQAFSSKDNDAKYGHRTPSKRAAHLEGQRKDAVLRIQTPCNCRCGNRDANRCGNRTRKQVR